MSHLATGEIATEAMVKEFKDARKKGEDAGDEFIQRFTQVCDIKRSNIKSYYDSISQQPSTIFLPRKKKQRMKIWFQSMKNSLLLSEFDGKTLQLQLAMHGRVTSKPWSIVNENDKTRSNAKSLFRNLLQLSSPTPPTNTLPENIGVCCWRYASSKDDTRQKDLATDIQRLRQTVLWLHETAPRLYNTYSLWWLWIWVPCSIWEPSDGALQLISNIDQELPHNNDWVDFLCNSDNRNQLISLLVSYLLDDYEMGKDVFVNNKDVCYFKEWSRGSVSSVCEELISKHREADQKVISHAILESERGYNVCVVADDSDIFILLLSKAHLFPSSVFFWQGKTSD